MAKVSILLAHFAPEAQPFLSACLRSLSKQTFKDFETILVSSNHRPQGDFYGVPDKEFHSSTRLHFPAAIAKAYEMSDPSSEMIFLLNDDVILSAQCLEDLVKTMDIYPMEMILGARSNCGMILGFYDMISGFSHNGESFRLPPQFKYEDVENNIDDIIENPIKYPYGVFQVPFCPFHSTMVRRATYEKVGKIDSRLKTGFDDSLFAMKARRIGINCYVALHASVAHASGTSATPHLTKEDREFNKNLFEEEIAKLGR